jgi:hypothetical protein
LQDVKNGVFFCVNIQIVLNGYFIDIWRMKVKLDIPVPAYLFRFMMVEFGEGVECSRKDYLFKVLFNELEPYRGKHTTPTLKQGCVYFSVTLPERYFVRYNKIAINDTGVHNFISFADRQFKSLLRTFFDSRVLLKEELALQSNKNKLAVKKAIGDFMGMYGIGEDEYKFETAWKYYQRYQAGKSHKNKVR